MTFDWLFIGGGGAGNGQSSIWISFSFKEMIEETKRGVASNLKKEEIEKKPSKPSLNLFYDF